MRRLLAVFGIGAALAACGDGGGNSVQAFCSQAAADQSILSQRGLNASDNARALKVIEGLTNKAPSEIKGDMTTILTFLKASAAGTPDSSQTAALTEASQRVVQFFKDKCHLDLGESSTSKFSTVASSIGN